MTGYQEVFGGDTISPSEVSYSELSIDENTQLYWPLDAQVGVPLATRIMDIETDQADRKVLMPDATNVSPGETVLFNNVGSFDFQATDLDGTELIDLAPGTQWLLYLTDNSTAAGGWVSLQFGAATSVPSASALAGAGLKAIGSQLFWAQPTVTFDVNYSAVSGDRAKTYVWTGTGSGTLELPNPADVGNNWVMAFRNGGGGSVTVSVDGGANIDGATTKAYVPTSSSFFVTNGTDFYTIGFDAGAQQTQFNYTLVNVAGSGTYTLSGSELNNTVYKFTGILTGNRNVVVPTTVQQYWVDNGTTGAFTLTVKTALGTGVTVAQGERAILYCDGTNVVDADTASVSLPIAVNQGGTGATTASGARTNLGLIIGTDVQAFSAQLLALAGLTPTDGVFIVGDGATFVTESGATARTSLGGTTVGQAFFTLANPGAITFPRINADNSVSSLSSANFRTALGLGTGDSPEFTAVSIGNTDTTITRVSAGVIAVEGVNVLLASNIGVTVQGYNVNTAFTNVTQGWSAGQQFTQATLTSTAGAMAWNSSTAQVAKIALTENTTAGAPSNTTAGRYITLTVTQHASAAKTFAWNSVYKGTIPTMTTTLGARMTFSFFCADGTNWDYCGGTQAIS